MPYAAPLIGSEKFDFPLDLIQLPDGGQCLLGNFALVADVHYPQISAAHQDVLARTHTFEQALPNQVRVADVACIRTKSGWLYLAAVLDLHFSKMVSPAMPAGLVCAALQMAIVQKNTSPGLIVHSDWGTQ